MIDYSEEDLTKMILWDALVCVQITESFVNKAKQFSLGKMVYQITFHVSYYVLLSQTEVMWKT